RLQFNQITSPNVGPVNEAYAFTSATNAQTLVVALQLNLRRADAPKVTPQNYAFAVNYNAHNVLTVARALQYTIPVDDPQNPPQEVVDLLTEMRRELQRISNDPSIQLADAEARIDAVIQRFQQLALFLDDQRHVDDRDNTE